LSLPKQAPLIIRLNVSAANSGFFTLQKTQPDSLPPLYEIWLIDKYKKDSLNLRNSKTYTFHISKDETGSFGSNRFQITIRQNVAFGVHLFGFTAINTVGGAQVSWTTENEENYTNFTVQRSIDKGESFYFLDTFASNGTGAYTFTDKNPITGDDLYRVKIEDMNGTISYSNAVMLSYGSLHTIENNISVYPNPVCGVINLSINSNDSNNSSTANSNAPQALNSTYSFTSATTGNIGSYDIKIINITGLVIKSANSSSYSWQENVSSLSPGTYIIQVINSHDKILVGKSTFIKM
jgi:trimeric autotransporter adhesin